jgi:hypothetical protein
MTKVWSVDGVEFSKWIVPPEATETVLGVNVKLARVTVTLDVPGDAGGVEDELVAAAAGLPPLLVQPAAIRATASAAGTIE